MKSEMSPREKAEHDKIHRGSNYVSMVQSPGGQQLMDHLTRRYLEAFADLKNIVGDEKDMLRARAIMKVVDEIFNEMGAKINMAEAAQASLLSRVQRKKGSIE